MKLSGEHWHSQLYPYTQIISLGGSGCIIENSTLDVLLDVSEAYIHAAYAYGIYTAENRFKSFATVPSARNILLNNVNIYGNLIIPENPSGDNWCYTLCWTDTSALDSGALTVIGGSNFGRIAYARDPSTIPTCEQTIYE